MDVSLANNKGSSSQIRLLVTLMEGLKNCNILHRSSSKSCKSACSAQVAELFALVNGFDTESTMWIAIIEIPNCQFLSKLNTNYKNSFWWEYRSKFYNQEAPAYRSTRYSTIIWALWDCKGFMDFKYAEPRRCFHVEEIIFSPTKFPCEELPGTSSEQLD